MEVIAKWIDVALATEKLIEWGYSSYLNFIRQTKIGGAYDNGVLTRILIVRIEPGDAVRMIAYAENNPQSTIVEAIEAARTLYGRAPKKLYSVCNTTEGVDTLNELVNTHPDAVGHTEIIKEADGNKKFIYES